MATLLSLLWIAGGASRLFPRNHNAEAASATYTPAQLSVAALVLVAPILLFYIAAMLTVRSQEMKQVARAVGEVAVRLAQPENFSTDAVLSVSQAVRREIAAVGDGVERALARAGELETLCAAKSRPSNEPIRITRSASARSSTNSSRSVSRSSRNAERVRSAITGSHQHMTQDLDEAAERVVSAINGAGDRVTGSLEQRGEQITQALGRAGERVVEEMASRGVELVDRLTGASDDIKGGISEVGTTITAALEGKAQDITGAFERTGDLLTRHLQDGAGQVTRTLAETGRGVIDTLAQQGYRRPRGIRADTAKSLEEASPSAARRSPKSCPPPASRSPATSRPGPATCATSSPRTGAAISQDIAANGGTPCAKPSPQPHIHIDRPNSRRAATRCANSLHRPASRSWTRSSCAAVSSERNSRRPPWK